MKFVLVAILSAFAATAFAQPGTIIVRGHVPDTCKMGVDTVSLGKTRRGVMVVPRIEFEGFDVCGVDTSFRWSPAGRMVELRGCYKLIGINSNCPWMSFQRYVPTKCD